ncbi:hypothetical protein V3C99_001911 [Haemonchus contortus]
MLEVTSIPRLNTLFQAIYKKVYRRGDAGAQGFIPARLSVKEEGVRKNLYFKEMHTCEGISSAVGKDAAEKPSKSEVKDYGSYHEANSEGETERAGKSELSDSVVMLKTCSEGENEKPEMNELHEKGMMLNVYDGSKKLKP